MSDADLPEASDQGELEKTGLLSRSVGGYKQAQARAAETQAQQVRALDDRFKADEEARRAQRQALLDQGLRTIRVPRGPDQIGASRRPDERRVRSGAP
jgi:hypothetical protein